MKTPGVLFDILQVTFALSNKSQPNLRPRGAHPAIYVSSRKMFADLYQHPRTTINPRVFDIYLISLFRCVDLDKCTVHLISAIDIDSGETLAYGRPFMFHITCKTVPEWVSFL